MTKCYLSVLLIRLLLPASLLLSIAIRPFGLSIVYLLLYLVAPLPNLPDSRTFRGGCRRFLIFNVLLSCTLLFVHAAWHLTLFIYGKHYGDLLGSYPDVMKIGLNLGLVSYDNIDLRMALHYLAPECVMTGSSILVYLTMYRIMTGPEPLDMNDNKHQHYPLLTSFGKHVSLFLIMVSGVLRPSIISGIYFLVFMGAATAWSLGQPLERGFAVTGRCIMGIMGGHVLVLLFYQSTWLVNIYPPDNGLARYFGLTKLVSMDETDPRYFYHQVSMDHHWSTLASPLVILVTYYLLAVVTRELLKPKEKRKNIEGGKPNGSLVRAVSFHQTSKKAREKWMKATKKVRVSEMGDKNTRPLMRRLSSKKPSIRSLSISGRLQQDSTGSVVVPDEDSLNEQEKPTLLEEIEEAVVDFFQVVIRSSYIATTITMMAWSIMFHSWLTFVFLMWACIVWLFHNQRSFMLKSSPVLVVYAMFLLLTQYIYGMDLTEAELPSTFQEINLRQIGLSRPDGQPCIPLLIKSIFTYMFWLTLRQRIQEIKENRHAAVSREMAAPLHLTVSTATTTASVLESQHEEKRSRLLAALGKWLRATSAKYWIYVVVIMLFVIGITGDRMTIFRIVYMFLFLSFILMFQISWYWWRRLMYVFWITVIMYSMITLILIYVYQFDNFSKIIEDYLLIKVQLQHDLGLDTYPPADLFVKLLMPAFFVIITVMQVHYFHKDFMIISDPRSMGREPTSSRPSRAASTIRDDIQGLPMEEAGPSPSPTTEIDAKSLTEVEHSIELSSLNTAAKKKTTRSSISSVEDEEGASTEFLPWAYQTGLAFRDHMYKWADHVFNFLHIHLLKIIFVALMLLSVINVCAMHVPIMLIIAPAVLMRTHQQRICVIVISMLVSIYFMAKMIYQIDYIDNATFEVKCPVDVDSTENKTYNNAKWIGFEKATEDKPLIKILKGYIGLLAVFTFYSLVRYRQQHKSKDKGPPTKVSSAEKIMFPKVTRKEADIDIRHCIKYLFNYGFYKFGVEITLICLVGVIGSRMDVYAVIYAGWLLLLVSSNRRKQSRIWPVFTGFLVVVVPLQYLIAVGLMPEFCIQYPWAGNDNTMKHTRNWMFLPYQDFPPHATKLIFDFFLLLFASRQTRVFQIEKAYGDNYPGGSNSEDIGKDWETPHFINPIPDFLDYIGSWLDVIKRTIFMGMLWLTLAIMFLTGTNRVNLFSMGYLIGSFIFLWQGSDYYLRPRETILKWWSWLLRYNVSVVVIKTILQIPGCMFSTIMQEHACWLVQLLGIGCVDKFAGGNIAEFIRMSYNKEAEPCTVPQEDIGLAWDGVCFAFLILQRRLFLSYYFYRVIDETKAITVLASRGAELIEELRQKQMRMQEKQEVKILEKIKVKMERIKANQKRIQGTAMDTHSRHHDAENRSAPARRREFTKRHEAHPTSYRQPMTHPQAVRSGDYYMFDELEDRDLDLNEELSSSEEDIPGSIGIGKLVSNAMKTDMRQAVSNSQLVSMPSSRRRRSRRRSTAPSAGLSIQTDQFSRKSSLVQETERGITDLDDIAPMPEEETMFEKFKRFLYTVWALICSAMVSLTRRLMKYSRDYRYVSRTLAVEKRLLKGKEGFGIGLREGTNQIWEPLPASLAPRRKLSDISVPEIRIVAASMERGLDDSPPPRAAPPLSPLPSDDGTSEHESVFSLHTTESKDVTLLEEQDDSMFKQTKSPFIQLAYALWFAILAHTNIVCYMMVFINQIQSATILSLPLPLMVFLWGTLTIPRPTKTFWVTLIAYTEVIVLIKSMFQFDILPWNQKVIPNKQPFSAPRIIGIERKPDYALYDLLLLLIIFLHRYMLKSLGLWKESTPEIELREDTEYQLTPEDTKMIIEGQGAEVGKKYIILHGKTGPRHRLVNRLRHVEEWIEKAMRSLKARRSDPRITILVWKRMAEKLNAQRELRAHSEEELRDSISTGSYSDGREEPQEAEGDQEPGPSKPRDDHFSVNDDQEPIIAVVTDEDEKKIPVSNVIMLSLKKYLWPTVKFFKRMLAPGARVTADIYTYMFICDFLNFFVVIFGFAAFGTHQGDGGVQTYLEENKVPIPFLIMLILQFVLIIIDRALYLRKFILGKILFQYALVIGVHIWMFFVLPSITERSFNALVPPPMWYMIKCIYLLLSAYQIRCGYPRRIIGNFLCKSYSIFNQVVFRGFMLIPFVFELRTLMDWVWTDTSMTLLDWLKMEDIFANVFLLKCSRRMEDQYPQPRGQKKSIVVKYLLGGSVLAFVIAVIWFPLVFFAFGNTVGQPNPPQDVSSKIRIGPFLPVYQMSAQSHNIEIFTEQNYVELTNLYSHDRTALTFLSNYMYNDIAVIKINPNSTMTWDIPPPELARLKNETSNKDAPLVIKFSYMITHRATTGLPPTMEDHREVTLDEKERTILLQLLNNASSNETESSTNTTNITNTTADVEKWLKVKKLFPKFVKVFNKGEAKPAEQLMPPSADFDARLYRDVLLRLERENGVYYWRVRESCPPEEVTSILADLPMRDCDMLIMYTFNDKLFPETLKFISASGILGLYTTFVFFASRMLRGFFSGIYTKIMFDDLPYVDRVLQLCLDIYLVREAQELALEEDLFAKLVFLYRSPETMIKWSRPKVESEAQRALPPPPSQ